MFEMWSSINQIATIIYLGVLSIYDLRSKRLPIYIFVIGGIAGIVLLILEKNIGFLNLIVNLSPGIALLIIGRLTRQAIGYGDGLAVLIMGLFQSINIVMLSLLMGITLSGFVALILLLFFHKSKKSELAFIPFLAIAFLISGGILCV